MEEKASYEFLIQFKATPKNRFTDNETAKQLRNFGVNDVTMTSLFMFIPEEINTENALTKFHSVEHGIECFDKMVSEGYWTNYQIKQVFVEENGQRQTYNFISDENKDTQNAGHTVLTSKKQDKMDK